jgi:hypothetical protein
LKSLDSISLENVSETPRRPKLNEVTTTVRSGLLDITLRQLTWRGTSLNPKSLAGGGASEKARTANKLKIIIC